MSTTDIAKAFAANARDLQAGSITIDQARARNRELREMGGADYDRAKGIGIAAMVNADSKR